MNKVSVLLIDDNPIFLRCATFFLKKGADIDVVGTACGGKDALALADILKPDIALVDLSMADLPGLELIPQLRTALPRMGIIVLTLLDADDYRKAALAAGADGFVSKHTMNKDLIPTIQRIIQCGAATLSGETHGSNN
jgi:DNA-binding NarL/FixJ family response regulator